MAKKYTAVLKPIVPANSPPLQDFAAPRTCAFRNKVEVTIGFDLQGEIAVGFNLGSKMEDVIGPITDCLNVSAITPDLCERLRQFVISSGVGVFNRVDNTGVWKFALIRSTELGQSMLVICTYGGLSPEVVSALRAEFAKSVTSLYYVESRAFESWGKDPIVHHLSGPEHIVESLRGLKFEISPMSFFQTNTSGAELLFEKIIELTEVDKETILVDCCCGTGVIGLALAGAVKEVIGVDIEEAAIEDAVRNAKLNKIKNAKFVAGKAEDVLSGVLKEYADKDCKVVCIVDPPRGGLHKRALSAIRGCSAIRNLVYVACNPDSLVSNVQGSLMMVKGNGNAFTPVKWFGVDMFPHTDRVEVVMLLRR
jgi:tRNA (uracil-5-)-methyltransferase